VKAEDLLHRRFALASVNGEEFAVDDPERRPTIEFNEGFQLSGQVPARLENGKLIAENLATGRMSCGDELDRLENLFLAMLRTGVDIALSEHGTTLTLSQGETALVYTRADWVR
jgi:heat shock protein HslJ